MGELLRKVRTGVVVLTLMVVGGGFASAAGYDSDETSHSVTYTVLSFRAIALSDNGPVEIGNVRQGSKETEIGPTLLYATTWLGDTVSVVLDSPMETDLALWLTPGTPSVAPSYYPTPIVSGTPSPVPTQYAVPCDTIGTQADSVSLSDATQPLITSITDCGLDTSNAWVSVSTSFVLDATNANDGATDYTTSTPKTVYYIIDTGL